MFSKTDISNCIFSLQKGSTSPGCDFIGLRFSIFKSQPAFFPNFLTIERIVFEFYKKNYDINYNVES